MLEGTNSKFVYLLREAKYNRLDFCKDHNINYNTLNSHLSGFMLSKKCVEAINAFIENPVKPERETKDADNNNE